MNRQLFLPLGDELSIPEIRMLMLIDAHTPRSLRELCALVTPPLRRASTAQDLRRLQNAHLVGALRPYRLLDRGKQALA